jgi:hypothetical protein
MLVDFLVIFEITSRRYTTPISIKCDFDYWEEFSSEYKFRCKNAYTQYYYANLNAQHLETFRINNKIYVVNFIN